MSFSFLSVHGRTFCGLMAGLSLPLLLTAVAGCLRAERPLASLEVAQAVAQTSQSCRECHLEIHAAWSPTDHAQANRSIDPVRDAEALRLFALAAPDSARPELVLGQKPSWQPLVSAPGGRWQPHEQAFDPAKREFFNVFGEENRRAGEWGHWTGRGMNWNSMCAHCHMTGYQRRYDPATDSYASTWVEHGVGCIQCHGPTAPGHGDKNKPPPAGPKPPFHGDRTKMMQTCAPCHARNEKLTEDFQPGDNYHDHYRVTLPVEPGIYYPDGQQRDEDFNWTSVLLSRMGHAGVTCLDCHDPHTTKTILPTSDNQLCQQCHTPPGRVMTGGIRATPIDPLAHSRHQPGSAGNSCVACHMPVTTYMQRSPRHDHGWLKPDPLLTKELGIPNACSKCHEKEGLDWVIAKADEWHGPKLDSRQRARARAVAAAQAGNTEAAERLLALLHDEDIPVWRATYLSLLPGLPDATAALPVAEAALSAADPMERAAAVRFFSGQAEASRRLTPLLADPVRLVRLDAAWALSGELPPGSAIRRELDGYLKLTLDQPAGRLRLGQDLANRGDLTGAEREITRAVEWDPYSAGIRDSQGMVLAGLGRLTEAGNAFYRAAELAGSGPGAPMALRAGLAFAEGSRLAEAESGFRLAIRLDPQAHRARYNLGLLLAQANRLPEAALELRSAADTAPGEADYPFALATVLLRQGDRQGASTAAERTLRIDPAHAGARQVIQEVR
ncbi:tetratricopeptide repeat protein [Oleiharenicola lentus]|nr:tetratricopeptide repeat protein [Oleiharenicola lentus]